MPVPKINLSDLISPEEEGKKYIGPNINWEAMPKFLSDLLTLMDPSGMMLATAPISKAISPVAREKILSGLITSPERKELLNPERLQQLEELFKQMPKETKAHVFGSTVSKKPNPKDLDVLLEYPTGKDWWNISNHPEKLPVIPKVDLVPSPPLERVPSNVKKMKEIGKKKYGEDYDFVRILSILGLMPLSGLVENEE